MPNRKSGGRRTADGGPKRRPFETGELRRLFTSPLYAGFAGAGERHKPGRLTLRDARFYAPLIAAYSGMRLEEICQLRRADIDHSDGVPCMFVHPGAGRVVKNASARRAVPIHPVLIEAGLLDHRARTAGSGEDLLFPELGFTRDGKPSPLAPEERYGDAISAWFGRHCAQIGLDDPALVFHSFRHGFIERLFNTHGIEEAKVKAVVGHANAGESHGSHFRGYAARVRAADNRAHRSEAPEHGTRAAPRPQAQRPRRRSNPFRGSGPEDPRAVRSPATGAHRPGGRMAAARCLQITAGRFSVTQHRPVAAPAAPRALADRVCARTHRAGNTPKFTGPRPDRG